MSEFRGVIYRALSEIGKLLREISRKFLGIFLYIVRKFLSFILYGNFFTDFFCGIVLVGVFFFGEALLCNFPGEGSAAGTNEVEKLESFFG